MLGEIIPPGDLDCRAPLAGIKLTAKASLAVLVGPGNTLFPARCQLSVPCHWTKASRA
jgi:hypothetical protein